jgi:hypothetical protein
MRLLTRDTPVLSDGRTPHKDKTVNSPDRDKNTVMSVRSGSGLIDDQSSVVQCLWRLCSAPKMEADDSTDTLVTIDRTASRHILKVGNPHSYDIKRQNCPCNRPLRPIEL